MSIKDLHRMSNIPLVSIGFCEKTVEYMVYLLSQLKVIEVYYIEELLLRGLEVEKSYKEGIVKFLENRVFGQDMDGMPSTVAGVQ